MTEFRKLELDTEVIEYNFNSGNEELNNFFFNLSNDLLKEFLCQIYY